jgi:hypothetical protein
MIGEAEPAAEIAQRYSGSVSAIAHARALARAGVITTGP